MYLSSYPGDIFSELDRVQREVQRLFGQVPSIRGIGRSGYPALNVGGTPEAMEIYAFAPGLDPAKIEVNVERGVLTLTGERQPDLPARNAQVAVHVNERFTGRFSRAVSLPDDLDPDQVAAKYSDGVLHVSIKRRASSQPRRVEVRS
jgi:HSP20 family protein